MSNQTAIVKVPATFAADHFDRCGFINDEGGVAVLIRKTSRHWTLRVNQAALNDLSSDADYYGDDGLDEAPENIVASAKRTRDSLRKQYAGLAWTTPEPTNQDLQDDAQAIDDRETRDAVSYLVDSGRVNANDTVHTEKAAPLHEWERIARASIESLLASDTYPPGVVEWFAKRGIKA